MTVPQFLRDRWGGGIRPCVAVEPSCIERWDGEGEGPAKCVTLEAFGLIACLFVGRTPKTGVAA